MEDFGTGAGLAAMGFWLFIAIVVAAGIWDNIRKRDAQHETLRRAIESGKPIDKEMTNTLLSLPGDNKSLDRDLKVGGLITLFIAPGLVLMGWIMSITLEPELFMVLLGVGALLLFVSIGLLVASVAVSKWFGPDHSDTTP